VDDRGEEGPPVRRTGGDPGFFLASARPGITAPTRQAPAARIGPLQRVRLLVAQAIFGVGCLVGLAAFGWFAVLRDFEVTYQYVDVVGTVRERSAECSPALFSVFELVDGLFACGFSSLWRLAVAAVAGGALWYGGATLAERVGGDQVAGRWTEPG
jgi:hypothetical protein